MSVFEGRPEGLVCTTKKGRTLHVAPPGLATVGHLCPNGEIRLLQNPLPKQALTIQNGRTESERHRK